MNRLLFLLCGVLINYGGVQADYPYSVKDLLLPASARIVNGQNANPTSFHAHLVMRVHEHSNEAPRVGSGALISGRFVLTAALNVRPFGHWTVGLGDTNRHQLYLYQTTRSHVHPNYNPTTVENNVALIEFSSPILLTESVWPIRLVASSNDPWPLASDSGAITGYGYHNQPGNFATSLQVGFQRVLNIDICITTYPGMRFNHMQNFCASDELLGSQICSGDLGAPFTTMVDSVQTLVGIASYIEETCDFRRPAVYERLTHVRTWINSIASV